LEEVHAARIKKFKKGNVMFREKTSHSLIWSSTILMGLVAAGMLLLTSIVRANPDPGTTASRATFRTKCAMCHGPDGAGSEVGKSMNVPDLRSQAVQKLTDAELAQAISNGKGGMPPFKNSLSADQVHGLVTYIRSLHQKTSLLRREGTL
jgi:mono/diheme cytochrome c family protein